jgi:hypothetical protein
MLFDPVIGFTRPFLTSLDSRPIMAMNRVRQNGLLSIFTNEKRQTYPIKSFHDKRPYQVITT